MLGDEGPHGMTASAFTSVSVSPPMVLVVVDQRWRSHGLIDRGRVFCVNILAETQSGLSDVFAGRHPENADRFAGVRIRPGPTGSPILEDAIAFLDCEVAKAFPAGDHTVFLGRVVACGVAPDPGRPLLYYDQRYGRLERP
jgi:flavin reductase (DIM6/NTAB) family NADH-FMN oxidoreductase RutF